jgi:uncharacterized protein (TIGR03067 family)
MPAPVPGAAGGAQPPSQPPSGPSSTSDQQRWQQMATTSQRSDHERTLPPALPSHQKAARLDIMVEQGANSGETQLGIYAVKDGMVKICFGQPDKPRSTEFSSKEGSGNTLVVLERRKS